MNSDLSKDYQDEEKILIYKELTKLTQFLINAKVELPFSEPVRKRIEEYFCSDNTDTYN